MLSTCDDVTITGNETVLYTDTCTSLQIGRGCTWPTAESLSFDDLLRHFFIIPN